MRPLLSKGCTTAFAKRFTAAALVSVTVLNAGLLGSPVWAQDLDLEFEVALGDFRDEPLEALDEFALVNVLVEGALLQDRTIASQVQDYCERVQEVLGAACLITPWEGETSSRIVEALQQLYFEGLEVQGGLAKLVGLVVVGEVPLPVVHTGTESFPSLFPYTDLVEPAYVFDPEQERFVRTGEPAPQAEIWHGLIRPPGEGQERLDQLIAFFTKNAQFYAGDTDYALFREKIGYHDHVAENDAFDNEAKEWYLRKLGLLDRLFNYRFTGEWLQELSGDAVERFEQLSARTFSDADVQLERTDSDDVNADIGFNPAAVESESRSVQAGLEDPNEDAEALETVPDIFAPGPIRNFLKDYIHVVTRYISGSTELLERAGRRQSFETLASLITKMDQYHGSVVYLVGQDFERYLYEQIQDLAVDFELVNRYDLRNDFATPGTFEYEVEDEDRFVNGVPVIAVESAEQCSIERGSNFISDEGEVGRAITLNRKDNPLTAQDIAGVSGSDAEEDIEKIYRRAGYCSYLVRDRCLPAASKVPLLDFASSTPFDGDYDYRRCFNQDGPPVPEDIEEAFFHQIPSAINHVQPDGAVVQAELEAKTAHFLPHDAVRHGSFYVGGVGQYDDRNVLRLRYPNFFSVEASDEDEIRQQVRDIVADKERELRRLRVEANWQRFAQYLNFTIPSPGRADFWNYAENPALRQTFADYRQAVIDLLRQEIDPVGVLDEFELVERYLSEDLLSEEQEVEMETLLDTFFPNAMAQENMDLKCDYFYSLPPVDVEIPVPESDPEDLFAGDFSGIELPKFNPPSVTRKCSNKTAKSTRDEARDLKAFYEADEGVQVDIAFLHEQERFIEIMSITAVALYLTATTPAQIAAAIQQFDQQISDLESGSQPVTIHTKTVTPVPLALPGELEQLLASSEEQLYQALRWLHLGIESKHREGLSLLSQDKEMLYLVLNGTSQELDFTLSQLRGTFDPENDVGSVSREGVLEEVENRAKKLQQQQEERRQQRAKARQVQGEKSSECGDSVSLIEWPGAVGCWLDEIVAGPLIEPAQPEAEGDDGGSPSGAVSASSGDAASAGEIRLSQEVLTLRDRAQASLGLPLEVEVSWEGEGAIRVVPARQGTATIVPESLGTGTIRARFSAGGGPRVVSTVVQVVDRVAVLRQVETGEVTVGTDEALLFEAELRDAEGQRIEEDALLQVFVADETALEVPASVSLQQGLAQFEVKAGSKAVQTGLSVGSDTIARSAVVPVHSLAGAPAQLEWDFGDAIVGLDGEIEGVVRVLDAEGNPYRAEGLRLELAWDEGLSVNGKPGNRAFFFLLGGESNLRVTVSPEKLEELEAQQPSFGYETDEPFDRFAVDLEGLKIRALGVDGVDALELPDPVELDVAQHYRVQAVDLPDSVTVGERFPVILRVFNGSRALSLEEKDFVLQREFAGEKAINRVEMKGTEARGSLVAPPTAGVWRLSVDDPDFGSLVHEVEVLGQAAATVQWDTARYAQGQVSLEVSGRDALGNRASLQDRLVDIEVLGDGGDILEQRSEVIENDRLATALLINPQPDRIRVSVTVEGFTTVLEEVLAHEQRLTLDELRQLPWDTPYAVLAGGAYGDYRAEDTVAQAMLYGDLSKLQAVTTELTPHEGFQRVAQMWPSGRVSVGPDMKVEVVWEDLKPVLVFSDPDAEVGRLLMNPTQLDFELERDPVGDFAWDLQRGRGKALLVPDQADFVTRGRNVGELVSPQGQELIHFDEGRVLLHDPQIQTEVFDDAGDVLIVEFTLKGQILARWYLHWDADQIAIGQIDALQWQFTGQYREHYDTEGFYAGESTQGPQGLSLLKTGERIRYGVGKGRSALDDARDLNGQGFTGNDKSALAFLAGNTVGESMLLQSEGMVNLGDPVISLRQIQHRQSGVGNVEALPETAAEAEGDFSIGQMVYAPENGEVRQMLRVDVERDREDDLLLVVQRGQRSVVQYLEGQGEGFHWGSVSDLLDLGTGVKQVMVAQRSNLLVHYESGQLVLEQNRQGRYIRRPLDLSPLGAGDRVSTLEVRDFDDDGFDDLLMLTGTRQLWIWYGSQNRDGLAFGAEPEDRQLLKTLSVRFQEPDSLQSAAWLFTPRTPAFVAGCRDQQLECKRSYFRAFRGISSPAEEEEVDRLALLQQQAEQAVFQEQEALVAAQQYLVRLDQLSDYKEAVEIELVDLPERAFVNEGQQIEMELRFRPLRTEEVALQFDLGADFRLLGRVACEGCSDELQIRRTPDTLWSLEGSAQAGRVVTLRFTVEYLQLPDFSFQVMQVNDDPLPDIGINVAENSTGRITVFESRAPREYVETLFGSDNRPVSETPATAAQGVADVLRGIGLEGKSQEEIKQMLLDSQQDVEASSAGLLESFHADENFDGYPDVFQENPALVPDDLLVPEASAPASETGGPVSGLLQLLKGVVPQAQAQQRNRQNFNDVDSSLSSLNRAALTLDNVEANVQRVVKALKCSRGCLPLPINFAFLAPGPINVLGTPSGFDPGFPVFAWGVPSLIPVWPPSPYQGSLGGRLYISPTLTAGLGIGICVGPWLLGQCWAFSVPVSQLGGEGICDAAKQGLGNLMQGVQTAVGSVTEGLANQVNRTGVIKARVNPNPSEDISSVLGVFVGGNAHNKGPTPRDAKVVLNPIPNIFVDWWDRQWEEVVNSLTDVPDITVRLPDLGNAFGDEEFFDRLSEKVSGETFLNLQQLYDLINSLPVISLNADVIQVQVPWIEPGMLRRIEQSLYQFLFGFFLELVQFMRSFNLPCDITVTKGDLFRYLKDQAQRGRTAETDAELAELKAQLHAVGDDHARAEVLLEEYARKNGLSQPTVELRRRYLEERRQRQQKVDELEKQYSDLEDQINRLEQPQKITDILPVFGELMRQTNAFWQEQVEGLTAESLARGTKQETAEALRSCVAVQLAADVGLDVDQFVSSIRDTLEKLENWKTFPRQLAKYLNALEIYLQEVIKMVDGLTQVVLGWWSEFEKKLDLWIDVLFAYQEFVALIKLIIDILKGYNKKCGLCTSDRLTLKELILKLVFGVVPKFPIIDFPSWPDVKLDFSQVQLGVDVTVPVFDVKTLDLRWPKLPEVRLPRFGDIKLGADAGLSLGLGVELPAIPLNIPGPPELPPFQPLPQIPQINLPNLPPAPEVPAVLEGLLPLMRIIQTILDIWCLINKSLIPIDEKQLKTQIENLTNRSLNLILPVDLLLEFDFLPGDLLSSLVPFDLINVESQFSADVNIDPFPNAQQTIDQQFHAPMEFLLQQVDAWVDALRNSAQQGVNQAQSQAQNVIDQFDVQTDIEVQGGFGVEGGLPDDFFEGYEEILNFLPQERPTAHRDAIDRREEQVVAHHQSFIEGLEYLQSAVGEMSRQDPQELLASLAELQEDHVLVAGEPSLLKYQLSTERKQLAQQAQVVERSLPLVEKSFLLAQLDESKDALEEVQQQLLGGTEPIGPQHIGVAVVRDGQARRIQDYPLDDPVVQVWDDDVLLAYEGAVYVKSVDRQKRQADPYQGRVLRTSLAALQRSKVHHLQAESIAREVNTSEEGTVRWSWDAPGVSDVELTVWDSVAGAQQLSTQHLRFYLHREEERSQEAFESLTAGVELQEGQDLQVNQELKLRFGEDLLIIPAGVQFRLPALQTRLIELTGSGQVLLELLSGEEWNVELTEEVSVQVSGLMTLSAPGPQRVEIPALERRPVVTGLGNITGAALRERQELLRGERLREGLFYATQTAELYDEERDVSMVLQPGFVLDVPSNAPWLIRSGKGHLVLSETLQAGTVERGMVLLDEELIEGSYRVEDQLGIRRDIRAGQRVVWSTISAPAYETTLPAGHYYGRIREPEGERGYSPIVMASAYPRFATAQVIPGFDQIEVPIYTAFSLDARDYVIGAVADESFHWRLEGDESFVRGREFLHPGFSDVGDYPVELLIRNGSDDVVAKQVVVKVFLPELEIDEVMYQSSRVLRIQSQPPVASLPIKLVGERDEVQDWLIVGTDQGARIENRYFTDQQGVVQLKPLESVEGLNVVVEDGKRVARLFPNGRVVLNEDFAEECQNDRLLDADGYVKFRVSCVVDGTLVEKFSSRMLPDLDTDVTIVERFEGFERGVVIRSLQAALELVALPANAAFAPGGAQLKRADGQVLMVIAPDGQIELNQATLQIREQAFENPTDPLIWELVQNDAVLAEFQIKGPGDEIAVIDPLTLPTLPGDEDADGMLDRWEQANEVDDPSADPDADGLTNLQEFQAGTNPRNRDSDGDGLPDGAEVDPLAIGSALRKVSFSDVDPESPYFEAIESLAQFGFVKGYEDGSFKPDQLVTRAETIKILMSVVRCENCEFPADETREAFDPTLKDFEYFVDFHDGVFDQSSENPLKNFAFEADEVRDRDGIIRTYLDVAQSDWFYYCVEIATELGLIHGYRGFEGGKNALGNFIPNRNVNIAELMKMVIEAIGEQGSQSEEVYGPEVGWWNDPQNNYLAKAEDELQLLLSSDDYQDPLRKATRAEVVYAAYRVLRENGVLDFDGDGIPNQQDQCPCQPVQGPAVPEQLGCPAVVGRRGLDRLYAGIEITQFCECLQLIDADLFVGSRFFAVITGEDEDSDKVLVQSNAVSER